MVAAIAVTTLIKQLRPLQLLRLLQWRLLAHQPYVTTPATPSLHTSTASTLMACTRGNVRYVYMQCLPLLPLHLTAHKADADAAMAQDLQFPQQLSQLQWGMLLLAPLSMGNICM